MVWRYASVSFRRITLENIKYNFETLSHIYILILLLWEQFAKNNGYIQDAQAFISVSQKP